MGTGPADEDGDGGGGGTAAKSDDASRTPRPLGKVQPTNGRDQTAATALPPTATGPLFTIIVLSSYLALAGKKYVLGAK